MWKVIGPGGDRCQRGHNELIWFFLQAVRNGNLEECQEIVDDCREENGEREKLLNHVTEYNHSFLHTAVLSDQVSVIAWLSSTSKRGGRSFGFNSVLAVTEDGETALHLAAKRQSIEACKAVVYGCRVDNDERREMMNAIGKDGMTVLHIAARDRNIELVQWILSEEGGRVAGFNLVSARATENSNTALDLTLGHDEIATTRSILSHCTSEERMNLFLAIKGKNGWTVLHEAARLDNADFVSELLSYPECGLIINIKDNRGMTVLHRTIMGGFDHRIPREEGWWVNDNCKEMSRVLISQSSTRVATAWIDPNIGRGFL